MPFALPRTVSPRVAATLSRFAHYSLLDRVSQRARTYDITPTAGAVQGAPPPQGVPQQLTLIFDGADRSTPAQLHLGRVPVPSRFWSYDADRGILAYQFKSGGVDHIGSLTFVHAASSAIGTLSVGNDHVGVTASLQPVSYTCDVAITPAAFVTGVAPALTLHWDATDPRWSNATWITNALTFTWQVTGQVIVGQPTYTIAVSFRDEQTGRPWAPGTGEISALLDASLNFTMTLAGDFTPPPDNRSGLPAPASSIGSVFPYALGFSLSSDGTAVTGALLTEQASQAGTVLGLRGRVINPSVAGLYSVSGAQGPASAIGVYGGRLFINDEPVETASLTGSRLAWSGLTVAQQQHSGLPQSGGLAFQADGAEFQATYGVTSGRRVRPDQIARPSPDMSPTMHPALARASALSPTPALSPQALGSMTQFAFVNDVWVDAVQRATMNDFNQVLQYYMPDDMRQTYYNSSPPILAPWLQTIAAQGTNPAAMYQSLATAYLTNVLSHFNEEGADQLNAARAMTWLKAQTAASPVFQQHLTAIYAIEFVNKPENAALPLYQDDQANQASAYAPLITNDAALWRQTLAATIHNPKALAAMQQLVTELSTLAASSNLYWAYTFFRYLTSPKQLMIVRMICLGNTSDLDGSAFMRQCQANAAILSLLDPSHTFSQRYVEVLQVFQIGNLLPALFDLSGPDLDDFLFAIQLVLQQIAQTYRADSDPDVAAAAAAASALAQDPNLRDYVGLVQSIASANAGLIAWEQAAPTIQNELAATIAPEVLGVFMTAVPSVGLMGLVCGSMQWSSLSDDDRTTLATNGAELAIELVCAVVKRGVAIAAIWDTSSSGWEILKGLLNGDVLNQATSRLSSGFRRWIIESDEDSGGRATPAGALLRDEMTGEVLAGPDEEGLVGKIFGRNLDDFLGTRLGAALAVVNLVLTIYGAVQASDPLERVADGLMATSAGLDLMAAVGGWALGALGITEIGTVAVATIASAIGVLGILATVAGVAVLLYLVLRPTPNPVQQFISTYAGPAGFVMPHGPEIDYFVGYATGTEPQRVGCSFVVDPSTSTVLTVASDGTTVQAAGQSHGYRSVFVISTGGTGQSRIITLAASATGGFQTKMLTWATDNTVSFQPPLAPANPNYFTQLWTLQMLGAPEMDGAFPAAATFAVTASGASSALVWNGTNLVLGSGPDWRIGQAPMAPARLSMQTIRLYTVSKGQSFRPTLGQKGSAPRTWSVAPVLPSFLTLDTTSGQIAQSAGTGDLPVMPATQYTLSVTNGVGTAPPPASFTIEVNRYAEAGRLGEAGRFR